MKKALYIARLFFCFALGLYALYAFVVAAFPALTNHNDSFFFFNWLFVPIGSIVVLAWQLLGSRRAGIPFVLRLCSVVCMVLLAVGPVCLLASIPFSSDFILQAQSLLAAIILLLWGGVLLKKGQGT